MRVCAGQIENDVGTRLAQYARQCVREQREIRLVGRSIRKFDVQHPRNFAKRKVLGAVHAERVRVGVAFENRVCSVSLMYIEIDHHCTVRESLVPERADGDRDIVEDTEPLAVRGERVVSATGEIHRDTVGEGVPRGRNRPADRSCRPFDQRRTPRETQPPDRTRIKRPIAEAAQILGVVDAAQRVVARRFGPVQMSRVNQPFSHYAVTQQRVLCHREAVSWWQRVAPRSR